MLRNIIDQALVIAQAAQPNAKIYKHLVWSADDADITSLFADNSGQINTIFITRESTPSNDTGPNDNRDKHTLALKWYRSANRPANASTASEDTFQDDVETMRTAFKNNRKFTNAQGGRQAIYSDPMSARMVGFVMFKGVLCNYAELVVVVEDGPFNTTSV